MTELTTNCSSCKSKKRLTESLAAPLIAATHTQLEKQLLQKDEKISQHKQGSREKEKQITEANKNLQEQVYELVEVQLKSEHVWMSAKGAKMAKLPVATELEGKNCKFVDLQEVLKILYVKLVETQKVQAKFGIWITCPRAYLPVATVLRHTLLQFNMVRAVYMGLQTKTEMVYQCLTRSRFRHRIEVIVEAFSSMEVDLDKERKVIMKQWAKR